jgi:predicted permease
MVTGIRVLLSRLLGRFRQRSFDLQMDQEFQSHLEMLTDRFVSQGMTRHDAGLAAKRQFGSVTLIKEHLRERNGVAFLDSVSADTRYALRQIRKSPAFAATAILTLALGIGANSAIFSLIDAVMLKSLPIRDPQHLYLLHWNARVRPKTHGMSSYGDCATPDWHVMTYGCSLSKPFLEDLRRLDVFSSIAAFASNGGITVSGNGAASQSDGQFVSGDYFEALGVNAAYGRVFRPADDALGGPAVTVLSYGYWRREFGADPSAVGRTVRLNGHPFTIIGVAEKNFTFLTPGSGRDLWVPMVQRQFISPWWRPKSDDAGSWWIVTLGRLKLGVSVAEAQSKISALFLNDSIHADPPLFSAQDAPTITLLPAQTALTGVRENLSTTLFTLMLAVGIILLIACANVAGLMLARATTRQKEIAVRSAIGAGRGRLIRQLLTESLTLSVTGALLGIFLARWLAPALLAFVSHDSERPLGLSLQMDWRVVGFTIAAAVLTGMLFGLAPALRAIRVELTPALKEGGAKGSVSNRSAGSRFSLGNALVVAQVALTVIVLVGAGLLVHTLQNLRNVNPGFDTTNLLNFDMDTTLTSYGVKGERLQQFYEDLRTRFSQTPGVLSASYTEDRLLAGSLSTTDFPKPGAPPKTRAESDWMPIGRGYFATMKIPLLAGREFLPEEYINAARVDADPKTAAQVPEACIVNETFARTFFLGVNPIGQHFGADGPEQSGDPNTEKSAGYFIVGIVRDSRYDSLRREVHPTMYIPGVRGSFEIRTAGNPLAVMPTVRRIVEQAGNDISVSNVKTQTQQIDEQLYRERLIARLSSAFGVLALLLACIGLYGLLAYEVSQRTREIGIRMALGAQPADVVHSVIIRGLMLALIGAVIGTAGSLAVTRYLGSMLFRIKPNDPVTLLGVGALLLVVALAACYFPARRATRVDPLVALRYE